MGRHEDDEEYVIERRSGDSVGAFLWGLLLGAGAALLLAPRSGAETQREIGRAARRLAGDAEDRARDLGSQVRERVTERVDRARGSLEDRFAGVRESVEERADVARRAVETGVRTARSAGDDLRRRLDEAKGAAREGIRSVRDGRAEPDRLAADVVLKDTVVETDTGDLAR